MRFGIEDDFVKIQSPRRGEEEVKIFECLGQDEALHFIALLLGHDINKRGVAGRYGNISRGLKDLLAHLMALYFLRILMVLSIGSSSIV
jgi:hypothetical protein